ncbi:MAG TPA: glycosyltransferase family 2 protein [Terriglobales bacterium]|nr:glycosyltransferase family 2 protein [Terriglobales bacterium]
MDLSVILVSYRSRDLLLACLRGLCREIAQAGVTAEILVVDNDSNDGTLEALAADFPAVRVIANRENAGYARAVNQGLRATTAPFALIMNPDCEPRPGLIRALLDHVAARPRTGIAGPKILNPDCIPRPGALRALLDYARAHPKVGIAAPKIFNPPGETLELSARSFPNALTFLFNRYSLLTRLCPRNPFTRRYLLTDWDHDSVREVDWVSGACMLARRTAIEQVGGMDEAYFMFNEDVDWCRRMKQAGWAVTFEPAAAVVHRIGASRTKVAARVIWARHLGMIHYFHKHHPTSFLLSLPADGFILLRALLMIAANAVRPR